jgi:hypothetical protein
MSAYLHVLRQGLVSLAMLGAIGTQASAQTKSVTAEETEQAVRHMLERLPYYGVFRLHRLPSRSWCCLPRGLQLRRAAEGRCGDGREARERRR